MKKLVAFMSVVFVAGAVWAQERIELGIGAGKTRAVIGDTFSRQASQGDSQNYWIGYGLNEHWGVELGLDYLDFDGLNSHHQAINLSGVYRFVPQSFVHPLAKLGLGTVESKSATDVKTSSMGAKAAAGLEADFKYVSVGALFNYFYMAKSDDALDLKDSQAVVPSLFLTIHNAFESSCPCQKSVSTAPEAQAQKAEMAPVAKKDSDGDGVYDDDDKCPNTPAGVAVNEIGCAEKEHASVRLNVEFASGKADLAPKYDAEVAKLADFMKKFPETKVEIAGHTDNRGSEKVNTALSQKRADAVKAALVKQGVEASRVTAKGYGSSHAIADNKTKAGRDQNRRVTAEISVETNKKK